LHPVVRGVALDRLEGPYSAEDLRRS
jgi:hypothetical protein